LGAMQAVQRWSAAGRPLAAGDGQNKVSNWFPARRVRLAFTLIGNFGTFLTRV
jgi:hypothetical protein